MKSLLVFFVVCFVFAVPARAESPSPYKGGMNYTSMGSGKQETFKARQSDTAGYTARGRNVEGNTEDGESNEGESAASSRVWQRYKELAAGTAQEQGRQTLNRDRSRTHIRTGAAVKTARPSGSSQAAVQNTGDEAGESGAENSATGKSGENGETQHPLIEKARKPERSFGFGSIMQDYSRAKASRSQVHTMRAKNGPVEEEASHNPQ